MNNNGYDNSEDVEALYAKPIKPMRENKTRSDDDMSEKYDTLNRGYNQRSYQNEQNTKQERNKTKKVSGSKSNDNGSVNDGQLSEASYAQSVASERSNQDAGQKGSYARQYPSETLDKKDTNDIVKELKNLKLSGQADRLVSVLRERFELEEQFISVCAKDGIEIVEGDSDKAGGEHRSIGGLRVRGMQRQFVSCDEYDPDIIKKYSQNRRSFLREEMANDAATMRRKAAHLMWTVGNMERMIDPNSRVRYVRQESNGHR